MQPTTDDAAPTTSIDDPRVTGDDEHGYQVTLGEITYHVLPNDALGWCVYTGDNLDLVPTVGGGYAIGANTAQEWIDGLLSNA